MYEYMDEAEKVSAELEKAYKQASIYIQKEAQKIFDKFQSKHDLTRAEAELLLKNRKTPQDIEALKRLLQEDKKNAELLKEYESQAYKARIDRLSNLYGQLDSIVLPMIAAERRKNILLYEKLAEESYYQSIFGLQQYSGYGFEFKALDKKTIQKVLDTRWSGKNFSQTIWDNTHALAESVKKEILINLLTGRPLREAQQAIDNEFGKGYNKARRLVRTESAYVCNQIQRESYKACGIEKYIYVAILDLKTSLICRGLDKEVFPVSKAAVGVNYPPMHPWCRSTTIAYVSKDVLAKMKQSAIDPVTGKRITVPGDMTYKEWYEKYAEKHVEQERRKHSRTLKFTHRSGKINLERNKLKRGIYPVTQKQIDGIIQSELSGVSFSAAPTYNGRIASPGKTSIELYSWGEFKKVKKIEIGKQYRDTKESLIDTLLHEELEVRLAKRYGSKMYDMPDDEIHGYIDRVIERFFKIKGLDYELV